MSNDVKIGVSAVFDGSSVDSGVSSLANKVNQANKTQYNPISDKAIKNAEALNKAFQQLIRVDADLKRRARATGQANASYESFNWESAYPSQQQRAKKQQAAQSYVQNPQNFGGGGGNNPSRAGFATNAITNATQAGLRATGPAGGVVANALGTGMSAGFGAGAMGLLGGMLALGVGKLVGAAMEKVTQAENNSVAMDALKRSLGDVNISFAALKAVVNSGADNLKITYEEAGRLTSQFVKLGNVSGDQYKSLAGELDVGVGMSRAFGLDPSQGMGVMGQMRGVGVTSNTQDSRKFALLIGETIGKADAFAKSGEVMEAISGFATSQSRTNLGIANSDGYAGMLSAMVGSKTPGLDVAGSSAVLGKINSSLSGGGSHGEASQFFTGMVGSRMGLDPIQTQIMREGGAFASNDKMFGAGSSAAKYGISGPSGNKTFLQGSLEMLREKYGDNPGMLAQATSNHLGIGINQAMGVLSIKPNEMGEMQKYADIGKLSGSGIGNLSKSLYGSDDERKGLASSLLGRKDVSSGDKSELQRIMNSGSTSEQKEILAKLTAQYDQERTIGSDTRDLKNAADNIKTNLADTIAPALNKIREGIFYMAGKGNKSANEVLKDIYKLESKDQQEAIGGEFQSKRDALIKSSKALKPNNYMADPAYVAAMKKIDDDEKNAKAADIEYRDGRIKSIARPQSSTGGTGVGAIAASTAIGTKSSAEFLKKYGPAAEQAGNALGVDPKAILGQWGLETGWGKSIIPGTNNLGNIKDFSGKGVSAIDNMTGSKDKYRAYDSPESFSRDYVDLIKRKYPGAVGSKSTAAFASALKSGGYAEDPDYVKKIERAAQMAGTPLPDGGAGAGRGSADSYRSLMLQAEPIVVEHRNERGEQVRPSQQISVNVSRASPFGSERFF